MATHWQEVERGRHEPAPPRNERGVHENRLPAPQHSGADPPEQQRPVEERPGHREQPRLNAAAHRARGEPEREHAQRRRPAGQRARKGDVEEVLPPLQKRLDLRHCAKRAQVSVGDEERRAQVDVLLRSDDAVAL